MDKQQLLDGTIVDIPDYGTTPLNIQGGALVPSRTPSPYFSSEKALTKKQEADKTIARLTPAPSSFTTTTQGQTEAQRQAAFNAAGLTAEQQANVLAGKPTETKAPTTKVTLINPNTEQTVTFEDASINRDSIQGYMNAGYQVSEASGVVPSWLTPTGITAKTPEQTAIDKTTEELEKAKTDRDTAVAKLTNFNVSNDPALQSLVQGIIGAWDARIKEMEQVNKSRVAAITQTGIRMGSRYTGGAGGTFGSIISAEEQAAIGRITGLESQKQAAISDAKLAYEDKQWNRYVKLADLAQNTYKEQLDAIKELNKAQAEKDKDIQGANNLIAISSLMAEGITNPNTIISTLSKLGYKIDAKTLKDSMDSLMVENPELKAIGDLRTTAVNNGAPQDVINAIISATDLGTAYRAAGIYGRGGTGIVGEYNRAVAGGYTGSFDDYQTADANRKRSIITNAEAGLNFRQQNTLNSTINKYFQSDGLKSMSRAQTMQSIVNEIEKNPSAGGAQLALIYSFIKVLDTDSAVREGEIELTRSLDSFIAKFGRTMENIVKNPAKPITEATALEIARESKTLIKTIKNAHDKRLALSTAQIRANKDPQLLDAWNGFVKEVGDVYSDVGGAAVQDEQTANTSLSSFRSSNPDKIGEMDSRIQVMETELGRPITSMEFLQAFPEYQQ